MTYINITNFRKDIYKHIEQTINLNAPMVVNSKAGNVVVINEDEYRGIIATLELNAIPGMVESILASKNAPDSEFVDMNGRTFEQFFAEECGKE